MYDRKRVQFIVIGGFDMRKWLVLLVAITSVVMLAACSDGNENEETVEKVTSVETAEVKKGDFTVDKSMYGRISPMSQMPVMIEVPGEIKTLNVKNGDEVSKDKNIATIKTQAGDQTVKAPKAGTVAQLNVQEGGFQSNEDPLLMLVDLDKVKISFQVATNAKDQFKTDKNIDVYVDDKKYKAKILPVDTVPGESGQFTIEAEIDNEKEKLTPGMTGKVAITDKKVKDTLIVPTAAIISEYEDDFVYIVKDGKAKKVAVEVVETQTETSAVKGKLKKGEEIVVSGHFTLTDDSQVEVVKDGNEE